MKLEIEQYEKKNKKIPWCRKEGNAQRLKVTNNSVQILLRLIGDSRLWNKDCGHPSMKSDKAEAKFKWEFWNHIYFLQKLLQFIVRSERERMKFALEIYEV